MGIAATFAEPFYEGTAVASEVPGLAPVAINGRRFVIEIGQDSGYERHTVPPLREPSDTSAEAGEQTLNPVAVWRRSQSDWRDGAGQVFYDDVDPDSPSDRQRFWDSKGVDVWGERTITLLPDTDKKNTSTSTTQAVLVANDRFYALEGTDLKFTADPSPDSPTYTPVTGYSTTAAVSWTSDGFTIYTAHGATGANGGIFKSAGDTSTAAQLANVRADLVAYANGFLIAADNATGELFQVSFAGAKTTIKTHPNANFDWSIVAGAPNGIYAGGQAGDKSEIYVTVVNAAGSLAAPVLAAALPDGETLNCMVAYGGSTMILGTSAGLRLAAINGDGSLTYFPAVEVGAVTALEPQGKFCWFTLSNYDGSSTGLGRVDLSRATEPGVPAYASDLMATGQGTVSSIVTFAGKRYFAVKGLGIFGEHTDKVASGQITSSWVRWGTLERKGIVSLEVRHAPLNGTITPALIQENGTESDLSVFSAADSVGADPIPIDNVIAEAVRIKLTLARSGSDATLGPEVRRWTLRAVAIPVKVSRIVWPVVLHEKVTYRQHALTQKPLDVYGFFDALAASRDIVRAQEAGLTDDVYVNTITVRPSDWSDDFAFYRGLLLVEMFTVK